MKKSVLMIMCVALVMCPMTLWAAEKPYHFTYAYGAWDLAEGRIAPEDQPNDPFFQYVEKQVGAAPLTYSWEWEGEKGYVQGLRLHMASEGPLDAMRVRSLPLMKELIENKMVIPLDDLLQEYMPEIFDEVPEAVWTLIRAHAPDGKIYYLPSAAADWFRVGHIRKDWLDRVGLEMPTTKEELIAVYKAFRDQDANGNGDPNDEIPVSGREGLRWADDLFFMHGAITFEGHPRWSWDAEKQQMISHQVSPEMKATIEFLRYLVAEGLMDPTMPIQKSSDWSAKINAGTIGHWYHIPYAVNSKTAFLESEPNAEVALLPIMKVKGKPLQQYVDIPIMPDTPSFCISIKAQDPGKIMEWLKWGRSKEGEIFKRLGIPGVNWKEEDGKIVILKEAKGFKYLEQTVYRPVDLRIVEASTGGAIKRKLMEEGIAYFQAHGTVLPADVGMSLSVYEGYSDYLPENAMLYREYASKIVLGTLPMEAWDEYVHKWNDEGGAEVTKRATEWYKQTYNIQ